jgi:hypothetical protein
MIFFFVVHNHYSYLEATKNNTIFIKSLQLVKDVLCPTLVLGFLTSSLFLAYSGSNL